jgi:hypothetical protein
MRQPLKHEKSATTIHSHQTIRNICLNCILTVSQESTALANTFNVGVPCPQDLTLPMKSSTLFKHVAANRKGLSRDPRLACDRCDTYVPAFSRYAGGTFLSQQSRSVSKPWSTWKMLLICHK